jgi:hypothetical protein
MRREEKLQGSSKDQVQAKIVFAIILSLFFIVANATASERHDVKSIEQKVLKSL